MHKKIYTIGLVLIALAFVSPLIVRSSSYIFPFIVPKILFFRSVAICLTAAWVTLFVSSQSKKISFQPLHYAVFAFLLSFVISTFTGVDWYRSFWDNHERMLGLFTLVHFGLFFFITSVFVRTKEDWKKLFRAVLLLGMPVMAIALIQVFHSDFLLNRGARSASTLGNPIYVGGYGLFLLALAYLLYWKEQSQYWKWFSIVGGVLGFFGLLASGTRGSMLGLFLGAVVMYAIYFFGIQKSKKVRNILIAIPLGALLILSSLFLFRQTSFIQSIPGVNRVVTANLNSRTLQTRTMAWNLAVEGAQEKAVFGWGPNNYFYLFNEYYNPEFLRFGWQETWFDNAHNVVFNTLATQGWFGIVTYLGMFVVSGWTLFRLYKKKEIDIHVLALGIGFLVMHFTHNFFVFENPTSYLYFMFFLAYIAWLGTNSIPQKPGIETAQVKTGALVAISVCAFVFILITNINPGRANKATLVLLQNIGRGIPMNHVDEFQSVQEIYTPHIDDIRNDIARIFTQVVPDMIRDGRQEEVVNFFPVITQALEKNKQLHPLDIRIDIQLAELNRTVGQFAPEQREELYGRSEQALQRALTISPNRQQLQFSLSALYVMQQRYAEAEELLKTATENEPRVGESWWRYAAVYKEQGNEEKVKEIIENGKEQGAKWNKNDRQVMQNYLEIEPSFFE